ELHNVPVPGRAHAPVPLPLAARLFGRLALADEIARRLVIQEGWYYDEVQALPPGMGETIACLPMPRLASLSVPVVVLAQYDRVHWMADAKNQGQRVPHRAQGPRLRG